MSGDSIEVMETKLSMNESMGNEGSTQDSTEETIQPQETIENEQLYLADLDRVVIEPQITPNTPTTLSTAVNQSSSPNLLEPDNVLDLSRRQSAEESFKSLKMTQEDLESMRNDLQSAFKPFQERNFLDKLAQTWANSHFWKKFLLGSVLTLPTLVMGFIANLSILFVISGFSMVTVLGGGSMLSSLSAMRNVLNNAEQVFLNLGEFLLKITSNLAETAEVLRENVNIFTKQNARYENLLFQHMKQSFELTAQIEDIKKTEAALNEQNNRLEVSIKSMQLEREADREQLVEYQAELANSKEALSSTQKNLVSTTDQLQQVQLNLSAELDKMRSDATLQQAKHEQMLATIQILSASVGLTKSEQSDFYTKITEFVNAKAEDIQAFTGNMAQTQARLKELEQKLKDTADAHHELFLRHELLLQGQGEYLKEFEKCQVAQKEVLSQMREIKEHKNSFYGTSPSETTSPSLSFAEIEAITPQPQSEVLPSAKKISRIKNLCSTLPTSSVVGFFSQGQVSSSLGFFDAKVLEENSATIKV